MLKVVAYFVFLLVIPTIVFIYLDSSSVLSGDSPDGVKATLDGFLGFAGGYAGGLMAFLSAYFIHRQDKLDREITYVSFDTVLKPDGMSHSTMPYIMFYDDMEANFCTDMRKFTNRSNRAKVVKLQNVSSNTCFYISIKLKTSWGKTVTHSMHLDGQNRIIKGNIGTSEPESSQVMACLIDRDLFGTEDFVWLIVETRNFRGRKTIQTFKLMAEKDVWFITAEKN
ncbi:hypothetical protein [Vibrio lentus]|uniref:hypothetical protein n=1 Tax=Vibrio lentus TaxID=136468 RepID=UPI000C8180B7|nr:hypothetical protein [Vibrio lentus]PMI91354.1 hypothetical protein BCU35_18220 [Vibrio lentus]